jgi:hypothetical protein
VAFSKQFRALGRITGFFASVWAAVGAVLGALAGPSITGDTALSAAVAFALMYGTVGAIAGASTALLTARAETGRPLSRIPTWRLAVWGVVGGMAPAMLFGTLAFFIGGASVRELVPLLGLGLMSGAAGGLLSGSASVAAKKARLPGSDEPPQLRAT